MKMLFHCKFNVEFRISVDAMHLKKMQCTWNQYSGTDFGFLEQKMLYFERFLYKKIDKLQKMVYSERFFLSKNY